MEKADTSNQYMMTSCKPDVRHHIRLNDIIQATPELHALSTLLFIHIFTWADLSYVIYHT